jgi:hypothetical protein
VVYRDELTTLGRLRAEVTFSALEPLASSASVIRVCSTLMLAERAYGATTPLAQVEPFTDTSWHSEAEVPPVIVEPKNEDPEVGAAGGVVERVTHWAPVRDVVMTLLAVSVPAEAPMSWSRVTLVEASPRTRPRSGWPRSRATPGAR